MVNNSTTSVSLVIPVFNNEQTLVKQLDTCIKVMSTLNCKWEIVLADDKSSDKSITLLNNYINKKNITVIFNKKNKGITGNIKMLYKKAKYDYVVLFSIDGDWNPKDITALYNSAITQNADVVIGKRVIKDYTLYRAVVSLAYRLLPLILFHVDLEDAGSIKIFKKEIFTKTKFISSSIFFEAEMLLKAKKNRYVISSVPVTHKKIKSNKVSGVNLNLILSSLRDMIKLRFNYD